MTAEPDADAQWTHAHDGPHRSFVDSDGRPWRVYELNAPSYDRRQGSVLVFDSDMCVRRIRIFPANWHELSDRDLEMLADVP